MRLASLAADRIEVQFPSKELARAMVEPTTADAGQLKKMHSFLVEVPTMHPELRKTRDRPQANHVLQ